MKSATSKQPAGQLRAIGRRSLTDETYDQIASALASGEYLPGDKLNIRGLAESLQVSPTPVREALLKLVSEGALLQISGRAIMVPSYSEDTYREVRDLRIELEGFGAARAATVATAKDIEMLNRIQARIQKSKDAGDYRSALRANMEFHLRLCETARLPKLFTIVNSLWNQTGPILRLLRDGNDAPDASVDLTEGHRVTLQALADKDPDKARAGIQKDILEGSNSVLRRLTNR